MKLECQWRRIRNLNQVRDLRRFEGERAWRSRRLLLVGVKVAGAGSASVERRRPRCPYDVACRGRCCAGPPPSGLNSRNDFLARRLMTPRASGVGRCAPLLLVELRPTDLDVLLLRRDGPGRPGHGRGGAVPAPRTTAAPPATSPAPPYGQPDTRRVHGPAVGTFSGAALRRVAVWCVASHEIARPRCHQGKNGKLSLGLPPGRV